MIHRKKTNLKVKFSALTILACVTIHSCSWWLKVTTECAKSLHLPVRVCCHTKTCYGCMVYFWIRKSLPCWNIACWFETVWLLGHHNANHFSSRITFCQKCLSNLDKSVSSPLSSSPGAHCLLPFYPLGEHDSPLCSGLWCGPVCGLFIATCMIRAIACHTE